MADLSEKRVNVAVGIMSIVSLLASMVVAPILTYKVAIVTLDQRVATLELGQERMSSDLKALTSEIREISVTVARIDERVAARNGQPRSDK